MKILLFPFFLIYRFASSIKNFLYNHNLRQSYKAPIPVISIGNLAFGGSEKTPLAVHLLTFLLNNGFRPALVTRGYKGTWEKQGGVLSDGKKIYAGWKEAGDEPVMVAKKIPQAGVFIGKHRFASCIKAQKMGFNVTILDDGFQHRRLYRDLDIVLYNPEEKVALRESPSSLKRAHLLMLKTGIDTNQKEQIKKKYPQAEICEYSVICNGFYKIDGGKAAFNIPSETSFKDKKLLAFCGIARPDRFFSLLKDEGLALEGQLSFPDHFSYPPYSLKKIIKKYNSLQCDLLITTEKDAIKLSGRKELEKIPIYYLKIDLKIEDCFYRHIFFFLKKYNI